MSVVSLTSKKDALREEQREILEMLGETITQVLNVNYKLVSVGLEPLGDHIIAHSIGYLAEIVKDEQQLINFYDLLLDLGKDRDDIIEDALNKNINLGINLEDVIVFQKEINENFHGVLQYECEDKEKTANLLVNGLRKLIGNKEYLNGLRDRLTKAGVVEAKYLDILVQDLMRLSRYEEG